MKFMPNIILSALVLNVIDVSGEGDGSTTCHSTSTIPGTFHGNDPAGTLTDGGFEVLVDDQLMSLVGSNILNSGPHTITVRQTNGETFMGLYMWGNSNDALSASSTDTTVQGGRSWKVGGNNVSCSNGSSALTHTGIESKLQSSGTLTMPTVGSVEVQVQPMTSFFSGSTYYWSSLTFEVELVTSSPTESPNATPTNSPSESPTQTPTAAPTKSSTEGPTQSPTKSPTKSSSSAPTAPAVAPMISPVTSNPTKRPVSSTPVTVSPTAAPVTASPTKAPTVSIVITSSPTESPLTTASPSESPVIAAPSPTITLEPSYEFDDDDDETENDDNEDNDSASGSEDSSSASASGSSSDSSSNSARNLGANLRGSKLVGISRGTL